MISLLFIFACDTIESQFKSPEEQLIDLRFEQKSTFDTLYTEYGGGVLVDNINKNNAELNATDETAKGFLNAIKNTVSSTDRAQFDADCLDLGQGKTVSFFTDKVEDGQATVQSVVDHVSAMIYMWAILLP